MPPRLVSVAILIYWSVAAFWLLTWEILPELSLGYPPDLRSIAAVGDDSKPVKWSIDVIEDPQKHPETRRSVGQAITATKRTADLGVDLTSHVTFDAGELIKSIPFANKPDVRLNVDSLYKVDPKGSLKKFEIIVSVAGTNERQFQVTGEVEDKVMEVTARGIVPILNRSMKFPYEEHGVVYDALRPFDRLPGLHVGQRWETRMINPFTGAVETVRVEVLRRHIIDWNGEAVSAFEVAQHAGTVTAKTWVRLDGMILRQEVPLPFFKMILERMPDEPPPGRAADLKGAP